MQYYITFISSLKRQDIVEEAEGVENTALHICLKGNPAGEIGVPERDCS